MANKATKYTSIRVLRSTQRRLKVLAAIKDTTILELVEMLSKEAFKKLDGKDQNNGATNQTTEQ